MESAHNHMYIFVFLYLKDIVIKFCLHLFGLMPLTWLKYFGKSSVFIEVKNKYLKEFYHWGIRLLMYADDLSNFETRLEALFLIIMSRIDWIDNGATPLK